MDGIEGILQFHLCSVNFEKVDIFLTFDLHILDRLVELFPNSSLILYGFRLIRSW